MKPIYGLVGHSIQHSLSPVLHTAAFKAAGITAEYRLFDLDPADPETLANFCYETEVNGIRGFSVTMPYKESVMAYMDHYDPLVTIVGSVNTVSVEGAELIGYNTDGLGALQALREKTSLPGKKALILGAGGAARALAHALKTVGADVHLFSRNADKAQLIADAFEVNTIEYRHIPRAGFDIILNATPVGGALHPDESLLLAEQIPADAVVMDLVTFPLETRLLKEAHKAGAQTISGERMLLFQAAGQFLIWFGKEAPIEDMESALYRSLSHP